MHRIILVAGLLAVLATPVLSEDAPTAHASPPLCKGSVKVAYCKWFRNGSANLTGDTGIVFWTEDKWPTSAPRYPVVGDRDMPPEMYEVLDQNMMAIMHGDFEVCFFKKASRDERQQVCIESVPNLGVQFPDENGVYPMELFRPKPPVK
jgi:hypothetical protein